MAHCTTEPTRITLPISGVSAQARLKENPQSFVVPNVLAAASRLPIKIGDEMIGGVGMSGSLGGDDEVCARQASTKPPSISSRRGGNEL